MDSLIKRLIMFMFICLPCRVLLAYIAKVSDVDTLRMLGYSALIPAVSFMYVYNTKQTGAFGQKAWWNDLRPLHSLLYLTFAMMAIQGIKYAHSALAFDALIGFVSFIFKHIVFYSI